MFGVKKYDNQMLRIYSFPLGESSDYIGAAATGGEERVRHGAVRPVVDVLHLPGSLPEPEAAAMPALVLHGAVHGGARGLRQETSKCAREIVYPHASFPSGIARPAILGLASCILRVH